MLCGEYQTCSSGAGQETQSDKMGETAGETGLSKRPHVDYRKQIQNSCHMKCSTLDSDTRQQFGVRVQSVFEHRQRPAEPKW